MYAVHTFVRTTYKYMIYQTKLSFQQVETISNKIKAFGLKEKLVIMCHDEHICGRTTVYDALKPTKYDGENVIHRVVLDAAFRLLQLHSVQIVQTELN